MAFVTFVAVKGSGTLCSPACSAGTACTSPRPRRLHAWGKPVPPCPSPFPFRIVDRPAFASDPETLSMCGLILHRRFLASAAQDLHRTSTEAHAQGLELEPWSQGLETKAQAQGLETEAQAQGLEIDAQTHGRDTGMQAQGGEIEAQAQARETDAQARGGEAEAQGQGGETQAQAHGLEIEAQAQGRETDTQAEGRETRAQAQGEETGAQAQGGETQAQAECRDTGELVLRPPMRQTGEVGHGWKKDSGLGMLIPYLTNHSAHYQTNHLSHL